MNKVELKEITEKMSECFEMVFYKQLYFNIVQNKHLMRITVF